MERDHVHLIGIAGSGMRAVARILLERGLTVSGSDLSGPEATEQLRARGARIFHGHREENLGPDVRYVLASAAITEENPELRAARQRGLQVTRYARALGQLMQDRQGIAVAGTHGKTTTTAMVATVLAHAGLDPSFVIGGEVEALGGAARCGRGRHFVAEACEFDRSFLQLPASVAVVNNIEPEHLDYFRDLDDILDAFRTFVGRVPAGGHVVIGGDDPRCLEAVEGCAARVVTCGIDGPAAVRAVETRFDETTARWCFDVQVDEMLGGGRAPVQLRVPGDHNVRNGLAALAVARLVGIPLETAVAGLETFEGVGRRFQVLHRSPTCTLISDYAHHPTEVAAVLAAARRLFPERHLTALFQGHQYSRVRRLLFEFAEVLAGADEVLLPPIFSARDADEDRRMVSAQHLAEAIDRTAGPGRARALPGFAACRVAILARREPRVVVAMGAGDIHELALQLQLELQDSERLEEVAA